MGDYDLDTEKIKKSMESGMRTLENGFQKLSNDVKHEEGVFGKLFSKSISFLQEGNAKYEDAYYEATNMSDKMLMRRYKNSSGFKRTGYAKALRERGLLKDK